MAKLGARILRAVVNTNSWDYADQFDHQQGSATELYVQLVNLDYNINGLPPGIRYIPAAGAILTVTLPSIDVARVATLTATSPFTDDPSVWVVDIAETHNFGSGNLVLTLTEGGVNKRIVVVNGVRVTPTDPSRCVSGY